MKALEILREQKQIIELSLECSKNDAVKDEYTKATEFNLNRINEAIKELEELENRSCANCKYEEKERTYMCHVGTTAFCCNQWKKRKPINGEEK